MTSEPVNYTWTRESTKLLIALRSEYDSDFEDPTQRKIDVWERISMILKENGYDFPPSICDKKWRNLLGSFRRSCSRSQGRNQRHPYTWEFYNDLVAFWQKKDPEGLKALNISVDFLENGNEQGEDTMGDDNFDNNGSFDDSYGQEQSDDDGVGDMARYLSVNLNEDEPDDQESGSEPGTNQCRLPYVPGLIIEEAGMNCQSDEDEQALIDQCTNEAETSDHEFQNCNEISLEASPGSCLNQVNRPRGRPYLPASVTIEELSTGIARPLRFKRKLPEVSTNINGNRNGIHDNFSLCESKPVISIHELSPDLESTNSNKRFREDTNGPTNSNSWLRQMKEQEANAQRRWEITERRQAREAEAQLEMDKQIQQSLNKLTNAIAMLVQRTGTSNNSNK